MTRSAADNHVEFARTILLFYALIAVPITILIWLECHFGMFKGLTLVESLLRGSGVVMPYSDPALIGML